MPTQGRAKKPLAPRKRPTQSRSKRTVEWILEAAARVFRREGFGATTNRIAKLAGVSVGTLYEYFPNKEAVLLALAERHVAQAEASVGAALASDTDTPRFLQQLQAAILESHRYPSQALEFVADPRAASQLQARVATLREQILHALSARARDKDRCDRELRARAVFAVIAELTSRSSYELDEADQRALSKQWLEMAISHLC